MSFFLHFYVRTFGKSMLTEQFLVPIRIQHIKFLRVYEVRFMGVQFRRILSACVIIGISHFFGILAEKFEEHKLIFKMKVKVMPKIRVGLVPRERCV